MKLRLFLLSIITVFVVSARLQALVGEVVEGAGDIVSDIGRGVSNVGDAITGRGHFYGDRDYYIANDEHGRPVRYYKTYREGRPAIYIKPIDGEEAVYLDRYIGYDPQSGESGEYYHPWKKISPIR